jgi:hypothetical protein
MQISAVYKRNLWMDPFQLSSFCVKSNCLVLNALIVAIEFLKVQCEGLDVKELTGKTIILLSNLAGVFNQVDQETLTSIISGLRLLDIDLIVM